MCVCVGGGRNGGGEGSQGLGMPLESLQVLDHQTVSCMTLTQNRYSTMEGLWKMTCSILQIALPHTVSEVKADVYVVTVCRHVTSETVCSSECF